MKISILGASSQIAQDLILSLSTRDKHTFLLFGRDTASLEDWVKREGLECQCQIKAYAEFDGCDNYDAIINFVGIGDPAKAQKMGSDIFKITEYYDNMALGYLKQHKKTKYIFLSSGAVYGGNYQEPVDKDTIATMDINNLQPTDWYTLAKLYAEAKHRSLSDLSIIDVRVFNYFSHTQDMSARFMITDIVRAIKNRELFKTSANNIVRDFITPPDFYNLIQAIIDCNSTNMALDCYTKSPISKFNLLHELKSVYGLEYEIEERVNIINATGRKMNYYSLDRAAEDIGYKAKYTSIDGVLQEMDLAIRQSHSKKV